MQRLVCLVQRFTPPYFSRVLCNKLQKAVFFHVRPKAIFLVTVLLCFADCEMGPDAKGQLSKTCRPAFIQVSTMGLDLQAGLELMEMPKRLQDPGVF